MCPNTCYPCVRTKHLHTLPGSTSSRRKDTASHSFQGIGLSFPDETSALSETCYPCVRTSVTYVSGLYTCTPYPAEVHQDPEDGKETAACHASPLCCSEKHASARGNNAEAWHPANWGKSSGG